MSRAYVLARAGVRGYELVGDGPGGCDHENREVWISNMAEETFEAVACLPTGAQVTVGDETFVPPWAM